MHHRRYAYELLACAADPGLANGCRQTPLQLVAASRQEAQELPHGRRHSHACACYYWMSPLTFT
jgi:hypothetical protein